MEKFVKICLWANWFLRISGRTLDKPTWRWEGAEGENTGLWAGPEQLGWGWGSALQEEEKGPFCWDLNQPISISVPPL